MNNEVPQVLLLGNGINRAFKSDSWDDLLNSIDTRGEKYDVMKYNCPETLKAVLVTQDSVDDALRKKKDRLSNLGTKKPARQIEMLRRLLSINFDHILTTNYSYELETAALGRNKLGESALKRMQQHTAAVKRCEANFMLHTYNSVVFRGHEQKIWHIHGEARKPDSMVLGHYFYGTLLGKMLEINKRRGKYYSTAQNGGETPKIESWTDAFILGDVYILGFGFGFAESDMWWLLNRKKREPAKIGKTYFYELNLPEKSNRAKLDLLRVMGAEIIPKTVSDNNWPDLYEQAIADIERRVKR